MKTWRDKLVALAIALVVGWIIWLFFAWYMSRYEPGAPRIASCLVISPP